jgi:hypothetical protein
MHLQTSSWQKVSTWQRVALDKKAERIDFSMSEKYLPSKYAFLRPACLLAAGPRDCVSDDSLQMEWKCDICTRPLQDCDRTRTASQKVFRTGPNFSQEKAAKRDN